MVSFMLSVSQSYVVAFVAVIKITGPPSVKPSASATDVASGAPVLLSFLDRASVVVLERLDTASGMGRRSVFTSIMSYIVQWTVRNGIQVHKTTLLSCYT